MAPLPPPDGWETATYPGDPGCPRFTVLYRRPTILDRMTIAHWHTEHARLAAEREWTDLQLHEWSLPMESEAMAKRLEDEDGTPWDKQRVMELGGESPAAFAWLSELLYPFAYDALTSGQLDENLQRCSELLLQILPLQRELAILASGGSMRTGTQPTESTGGQSGTTGSEAGSRGVVLTASDLPGGS